jgi:hypothetical protein
VKQRHTKVEERSLVAAQPTVGRLLRSLGMTTKNRMRANTTRMETPEVLSGMTAKNKVGANAA